jgi:hypothetical protein
MTVDQRTRRIGENEALYRSINEKIEDLNASCGMVAESRAVVCECCMLECAQQIDLEIPTYERVRSDPALFVVVPGHEIPDVESIVEAQSDFNVIRKNPGGPEELARITDPRA